MPETAASRKAQVVPLLDGHDDPEPSSSNPSSSRPSDENHHHHQSSSIDSLTPLTPRVIPPSHHHHKDPSFSEDEALMTGTYALRSWLTVFGAWLAIFSSFGLLTVLSICQSYLSGENEQVASISDGTFAWVFSLYFVVSLGLGMYVGPLSDRFGARYMVLSGTVFLGVGISEVEEALAVILMHCLDDHQGFISHRHLKKAGPSHRGMSSIPGRLV